MSHTLYIEVPEAVYQSLVEQAKQTGQSPEALAAQWLAAAQERATDPLEPFIGAFRSAGIDWADAHDRYIGQAIKDEVSGLEDDPSDA